MSNQKKSAVSNSGPLIHLSEIDAIIAFKVFKEVLIPPEVDNETSKSGSDVQNMRLVRLAPSAKDLAKIITARYGIALGEAEAIALAMQEKVGLFLTDDLTARDVAKAYALEPHGTLGILLGAFREGVLSKKRICLADF